MSVEADPLPEDATQQGMFVSSIRAGQGGPAFRVHLIPPGAWGWGPATRARACTRACACACVVPERVCMPGAQGKASTVNVPRKRDGLVVPACRLAGGLNCPPQMRHPAPAPVCQYLHPLPRNVTHHQTHPLLATNVMHRQTHPPSPKLSPRQTHPPPPQPQCAAGAPAEGKVLIAEGSSPVAAWQKVWEEQQTALTSVRAAAAAMRVIEQGGGQTPGEEDEAADESEVGCCAVCGATLCYLVLPWRCAAAHDAAHQMYRASLVGVYAHTQRRALQLVPHITACRALRRPVRACRRCCRLCKPSCAGWCHLSSRPGGLRSLVWQTRKCCSCWRAWRVSEPAK